MGNEVTTMKRSLLVLGLLGMLMASAFGQSKFFLQATIPFEFVAGGKTLPAGVYDFSVSQGLVRVENHDTGNGAALGFLTRIAADKTTPGTARVIFDLKNDVHFIQAIWPDKDNGYMVHLGKEESANSLVAMH
jgi:hypothetical protein